ncbi:glycosyltransferase family 2 protein [Mucilaginibacter agri]|uniref:Glycosyltransferase n=1 Tax=Mucilaginibacter agri TaxID=2695265 RepID=A0A965ZBP5_9SPHI|nr:glycosyltransferase [Mucilaginibacter agri]NCD67815.1 glycosyltransferase [Mucilaginibacter agri]
MKVSICIPTYNRPELLKEALLSCINQTKHPFEILIGDDSKNDDSYHVVRDLQTQSAERGIEIIYKSNIPSLGQRDNVNKLIELASGDKFVLLHDDDLLLPDALETMAECFLENESTGVVYGDQYIIDNDGNLDEKSTILLNSSYFRTKEFEINQLNSIDAAIVQQFPNDGYMIDMPLVKSVKYAPEDSENIGSAIDFYFGLRLAQTGVKFKYLNKYTTKYRITTVSIERQGSDASYRAFKVLESLPYQGNDKLVDYKKLVLQKKVASATMMALKYVGRTEAAKIYFGKWHRKQILSARGLKRGLQIILNII